jgi:FMN phosphatase YigB (HAD superfamily)
MKQVLEAVEKLSVEELARANESFPQFHSAHEGYAMLLEEVEELNAEMVQVNEGVKIVWVFIKGNFPQAEQLKRLKEVALHAAAEAIQVAAMCQKFAAIESSNPKI